tara:strand:+ start:470 stop:1165 length:696 start_codon:yes stop_codon:yes gene_type:complete
MSVKDCKDQPLEFDSVKLTGKRGIVNIALSNDEVGANSFIYEYQDHTLAIVSESSQNLSSAIAFEAQDNLGAVQTPLFLTGEDIIITGALTINGTPYVPYVPPVAVYLNNIPAVQGVASSSEVNVYSSGVLPAGVYLINSSFQIQVINALTKFLSCALLIQNSASIDEQIGLFYDSNDAPNVEIQVFGGQISFIWTSDGTNQFLVRCEGQTSDAGAFTTSTGGQTQYIKIA